MLSFDQARQKVIEVVTARRRTSASELADIVKAFGRILADQVVAVCEYTPFDRSTRDGFAVRAGDIAGQSITLEIIGEIKAGDTFAGPVGPGQCAQIMTGAAVPPGADAVVMIEHTRPSKSRVVIERSIEPGQNIVRRGSEAKADQVLLASGTRLGYAELALAAQVGQPYLKVFQRPRVAILTTLAGAEPVQLGNAPDRHEALRAWVERGLEADLLVLSGGVSMGKYDLVEVVLRELGAEFFFSGVAIRPGRPAVFGACRGNFVFGLPGNPVSTMVTFELFVLPALDILGGTAPRPLPLCRAKLAAPVRQTAALTHFLPAQLEWNDGEPRVCELPWQGSGDIVALAQANCYLVVPQTKLELAAGDWVDVLLRRGAF